MYLQQPIDLQSQAIYDDKNNSKRSLHILDDDTSDVQVGYLLMSIFLFK